MHVEHVIPIKHGGKSDYENLALACDQCNLHRGTDLVGIDEVSGERVDLFNPRLDDWEEHFIRVDDRIEGLTPTGRVTVALLRMNDEDRRTIRVAWND
jgi:hypothetical protein